MISARHFFRHFRWLIRSEIELFREQGSPVTLILITLRHLSTRNTDTVEPSQHELPELEVHDEQGYQFGARWINDLVANLGTPARTSDLSRHLINCRAGCSWRFTSHAAMIQ